MPSDDHSFARYPFRALLCAALAAGLFGVLSLRAPLLPAESPPPAPRWIGLYDLGDKAGLQWIHEVAFKAVEVHRRVKGSPEPFRLVGEGSGGRFIDTGAVAGETYTYRLVAIDGAGRRSASSAERDLRIAPTVRKPLAPPEWEGYLFTGTGIGLKWSRRPDEEVLAYNVYRRREGEEQRQLIGSTRDTSFHDKNLEAGQTYLFSLSALDTSFQESALSEEMSIVFEPEAPSPAARPEDLQRREIRTKLVRMVTAGDGPLRAPADVTLGAGGKTVFVSDSGGARVHVFDEKGNFLRGIGGDGTLVRPLGLATGSRGEVYCVDSGQNSVVMMDSGAVTGRLSLAEHFTPGVYGLIDAAVAPNGRIFIVDNHNGRILAVTSEEQVEVIGSPGHLPGQVSAPTFCAFDGAGNFVLSDAMNGRGQVFDGAGNFVRTFGRYRQGPGGLGRPKGIAVADSGKVFVADSWQNIVQVFDSEGRYVAYLTDEEGKPLDLGSPNGVALGPGRKIYIVERLARRLQIRELPDDL